MSRWSTGGLATHWLWMRERKQQEQQQEQQECILKKAGGMHMSVGNAARAARLLLESIAKQHR